MSNERKRKRAKVNADVLNGKVVLVTGAGSGLGEATARAFGVAGLLVACLDINGHEAERVVAELADAGAESIALACDVGDEAAVNDAVARTVGRFGRLDVAVNCAAIDHRVSIEENTVEQWDRVVTVNLLGPFLIAKAVWPTMRRQGSGHIVNIASTAAIRAWSNAAVYHATKFGLVGLGRGLSVEGRPDNIRVTTIFPGGMRTNFFERFVDQGIPLPDPANLQEPATVAESILFAVRIPPESALQEVVITPMNETSWP